MWGQCLWKNFGLLQFAQKNLGGDPKSAWLCCSPMMFDLVLSSSQVPEMRLAGSMKRVKCS